MVKISAKRLCEQTIVFICIRTNNGFHQHTKCQNNFPPNDFNASKNHSNGMNDGYASKSSQNCTRLHRRPCLPLNEYTQKKL